MCVYGHRAVVVQHAKPDQRLRMGVCNHGAGDVPGSDFVTSARNPRLVGARDSRDSGDRVLPLAWPGAGVSGGKVIAQVRITLRMRSTSSLLNLA